MLWARNKKLHIFYYLQDLDLNQEQSAYEADMHTKASPCIKSLPLFLHSDSVAISDAIEARGRTSWSWRNPFIGDYLSYFLLHLAAIAANFFFQYFLRPIEAAIALADFAECHCLLSFQANLLNAHAIFIIIYYKARCFSFGLNFFSCFISICFFFLLFQNISRFFLFNFNSHR